LERGVVTVEIETNQLLNDRAEACHKLLTVAGEHADAYDSQPEGIFTLLAALVFVTKQYGMTPRQLTGAIKKTREIIERAQAIAGENAGIEQVIFEAGVN
jgi:hypothetical protein